MTAATPPRKHARRRLLAWSGLGGAVLLAGAVLISGCAAFGGAPEGERLARVQKSPQWHDGEFHNPQPMWVDLRTAYYKLLFGPAGAAPSDAHPVPVVRTDPASLATAPASGLRVTWFGHSATLVEIDGSRVLVDPFWGERASPFSWLGPKRWFAPPIALNALPTIDVVVISHDHYDHLDQHSIIMLAARGKTRFVVPLGLGAHLVRWGVAEDRITELDWWQSTQVGTLQVVATPARHATGRTGTKSNKVLWAGYALVGAKHRVWYSGDTGFHDGLKQIGERLGPFDLTLIESGQYDSNWPDIHLGPELAVQAHHLVRGSAMIPVHWGLINLAPHGWTEPAERVRAAALCSGAKLLLPRPGQSMEPGLTPATTPDTPPWWPATPWLTASQRPIVATQAGVATERVTMPACPPT